jgi:hypothetical protein
VAISTARALVSQQGDLTGDGFETLADLSAFRQEQGRRPSLLRRFCPLSP